MLSPTNSTIALRLTPGSPLSTPGKQNLGTPLVNPTNKVPRQLNDSPGGNPGGGGAGRGGFGGPRGGGGNRGNGGPGRGGGFSGTRGGFTPPSNQPFIPPTNPKKAKLPGKRNCSYCKAQWPNSVEGTKHDDSWCRRNPTNSLYDATLPPPTN